MVILGMVDGIVLTTLNDVSGFEEWDDRNWLILAVETAETLCGMVVEVSQGHDYRFEKLAESGEICFIYPSAY